MEKPLSQRAAVDVKKSFAAHAKTAWAPTKIPYESMAFVLLYNMHPPPAMGFLAVFCLRALSSPECHFPLAADFFQKARCLQFSKPAISKSIRQNVYAYGSPEDILSASVVLFGIWCFQNDRNGPFPRQSRLVKFSFATPLCRAFCDYRLHVCRFIGKIHSFGNSNPWRKCLSGPSFRFFKYVYRRKFFK